MRIRSNSAFASLYRASRMGRARAFRNAEMLGLTSKLEGSNLMPVHSVGTKTLSARSEARRSIIPGQAVLIPGVTCVSESAR